MLANPEELGFNPQDQKIWNNLFLNVPLDWKTAEATKDMKDCLQFFEMHNVKSVLDVGCGIGIWAMFLSKAGFEVKGYDFSSNAIKFASRWAAEDSVQIEYKCCPITGNPFPREKFDGVIAAKVLDNISKDELEIAIAKIFKCLKDKGLLFCLFNPYMTPEEIKEKEKSDNPTKGITLTIYTDVELRNLFPRFKLLDFKVYEYGFRGLFLKKF